MGAETALPQLDEIEGEALVEVPEPRGKAIEKAVDADIETMLELHEMKSMP